MLAEHLDKNNECWKAKGACLQRSGGGGKGGGGRIMAPQLGGGGGGVPVVAGPFAALALPPLTCLGEPWSAAAPMKAAEP